METCAACHGENGEGYTNELNAPALNASEHAWHHPDQEICNWILNGKLGIGRMILDSNFANLKCHNLLNAMYQSKFRQVCRIERNQPIATHPASNVIVIV